MRQLFEDNPLLSLRIVVAEVRVHHSTVWHFFVKIIVSLPYKLQMCTDLAEDHKTKRKQYAQHRRREFRNDR